MSDSNRQRSPTLSSRNSTEGSYDEISVQDEVTTDDDDEGEELGNDPHSEHDDDDHDDAAMNDNNNANETLSLNELLQEKNSRIDALERANRMKDERLQLLQQKLNETKIKHKEGIYWLQLELDNSRRQNDATEEQMAELMKDLQAMTKIPNPTEVSDDVLRDTTIKNYQQALASMENQITMMKTSAGEVVKTLKEELAEIMEDRATMEVDLLNQLAALDNEKSVREAQYEHELKSKTDTVHRLLSAGGTARTSVETADLEEYEAEISRLMESKKKMEEKLMNDCEQAYEEVHQLELANARLKADLEQAEEDLAVFKSEGDAGKTVEAIQLIAREREETVEALERVAAIWEKADAAIIALEDAMDHLRPDDDVPVKGERERLLATLETASLVHGQIKVSLMLIELKLRNQLQSLKNDKLQMDSTGSSNDNLIQQMKSVQTEVLKVVAQVETTLSGQIQEIERRAWEETKLMKDAIQKRASTLDSMQAERDALEEEVNRLKSSNATSNGNNKKSVPEKSSSKQDNDAVLNGISRTVLDQLHVEALRLIERVKEKNTLITTMKEKLEEHKASEERLKKELKRALRKSTVATKPQDSQKVGENGSPRQSPKAAIVAAISPMSPLPRSPVKSSRLSSVNPPLTSPKTMSSISPLAPSPRELKSRVSLLVSPTQQQSSQRQITKSNASE